MKSVEGSSWICMNDSPRSCDHWHTAQQPIGCQGLFHPDFRWQQWCADWGKYWVAMKTHTHKITDCQRKVLQSFTAFDDAKDINDLKHIPCPFAHSFSHWSGCDAVWVVSSRPLQKRVLRFCGLEPRDWKTDRNSTEFLALHLHLQKTPNCLFLSHFSQSKVKAGHHEISAFPSKCEHNLRYCLGLIWNSREETSGDSSKWENRLRSQDLLLFH